MKTKELNRIMHSMGYYIVRSKRHTVWSNGHLIIIIPQHSTVSRHMAKQILKDIGYIENVESIGYKVAC